MSHQPRLPLTHRLATAWTAIYWLLVIWKSDLTNKMKCSFLQAVDTAVWMHYMDANKMYGENA